MLPYQEGNTTAVVEGYVNKLAQLPEDGQHDDIIRELLSRAVGRLHMLCATVLYQSYPRLTQAPLNLQAEELLSAVVERLLKAMQKAALKGCENFLDC